MDQPEFYKENNDITVQGTLHFLANYLHLLKWKNGARIMDIGSGDGAVLMDVLLPKLPKNYKKVVGIDVSQEMVDFAKENYPDEEVRFVRMDIATKNVPRNFKEQFDHIFSFYCLHWVPDLKQSMRNIYSMLRPGGDILILTITFNPIFDCYEQMVKNPKWAPHMKNWKSAVSSYKDSLHPDKEFSQLLKEGEFVDIMVKKEAMNHTFANFSAYQKFFLSVNPFVGKLPSSMENEYVEELSETIKRSKYVTIDTPTNGRREGRVHHQYGILCAYASRPRKNYPF